MTDYTSWFVGMKVVFIMQGERHEYHGGYGNETDPVFGKVYTIRELGFEAGHAALRLVEIVNPIQDYSDATGKTVREEVWFLCHNFRPVEERKTDISIFTRLLKPQKEKA